jgi:hypothetical protein
MTRGAKPKAEKQTKKPAAPAPTDILDTLAGEVAEAVEILRPHYPQDSETELHHRAKALRRKRYERGRWPSSDELATGGGWAEVPAESWWKLSGAA